MKTKQYKSLRLIALIENAALNAGNESKLAVLLEETRHNLSAWKHGRRSCPIEAQMLLAGIAKEDVFTVMGQAIIEKHQGTTKGKKLEDALKKKH